MRTTKRSLKCIAKRFVTMVTCAGLLATPAVAAAEPVASSAIESQAYTPFSSYISMAAAEVELLDSSSVYRFTGSPIKPKVLVYLEVEDLYEDYRSIFFDLFGSDFYDSTYGTNWNSYSWDRYSDVRYYGNEYVYVLEEGIDYTLNYYDNILPGRARVEVVGKGDFYGTQTEYFTISDSGSVGFSKRLSGKTRYDTMCEIADETFVDGNTRAGVAVLACGQDFPDALAASALAGTCGAPIILTETNNLTSQARNQLNYMNITRVYILGGTNAISANVESTLQRQGYATYRLSGTDRIDTALKCAQAAYDEGDLSGTVVIATGYNFADSLSISPFSYAMGAPIILTDKSGRLTQSALKFLEEHEQITNAIIVGGNKAVATEVETSQLRRLGISCSRIGGKERYETSKLIADFEVSYGWFNWVEPIIATGLNFPDALTGAELASSKGSVLLLANNTGDATIQALRDNRTSVLQGSCYYVLGGAAAVPNSLIEYINNMLAF